MYTIWTQLNWEGMNYPSGNRDYDCFEEHNRDNTPVNVYNIFQFEGTETIVLHRITQIIGAEHHISLLNIDDDEVKFHDVFIKDYDKLVGNQTNTTINKLHHCRYCQHGIKSKWLLDNHLERGCTAVDGQTVKLQEKGDTISFKNHYRKFKCPFVIYGEFECLTTKTCGYSKPIDPNKSHTYKYQHHKPSGCKIHVVSTFNDTVETHIYRGSDCVDVFFL